MGLILVWKFNTNLLGIEWRLCKDVMNLWHEHGTTNVDTSQEENLDAKSEKEHRTARDILQFLETS